MSQRSVLEINHDRSHQIDAAPTAFIVLLNQALASGSDESWEPLRHFGVRRIIQVHHSTDYKVNVEVKGDWAD
jgi:hypothetical protein